MADLARNNLLARPLTENPLLVRRVVLRRYARNIVAGILLCAMGYHIFVIETDWARIG